MSDAYSSSSITTPSTTPPLVPSGEKGWWTRLATALMPCTCVLCQTEQSALVCAACQTLYLNDTQHRCTSCAIPLPPHTSKADRLPLCGSCLALPPSFAQTLTLADYTFPIQELVIGLKFHAQLPLAKFLGKALAQRCQSHPAFVENPPALLVPIPLHPHRLAERGFNQTWEITKVLGRSLRISANAQILHRVREHPPQAMLSLKARQQNVRHAFAVANTTAIQGKHIGLVDDVMTTGSTLEEAARTLMRHGAAQVTNLVALRTP